MSGLSQEFEERLVNTILYCLGEEAKDILVSTNIGETERNMTAFWQSLTFSLVQEKR